MANNDNELITGLRDILSGYQNIRNGVDEHKLFLSEKNCPTGMRPCDPTLGDCPDDEYAPWPPVYNVDGLRCYTNEGVAHKKRTTISKRELQVKMRDFVGQVASLNAKLKDNLKSLNCDQVTTQDLCGIKTKCSWNRNKCQEDQASS